jgi:potassium-transporting ATPase A subunit
VLVNLLDSESAGNHYAVASTLEGAPQVLPQGPVAALEIIKNLGTNGGGFKCASQQNPKQTAGEIDPEVSERCARFPRLPSYEGNARRQSRGASQEILHAETHHLAENISWCLVVVVEKLMAVFKDRSGERDVV